MGKTPAKRGRGRPPKAASDRKRNNVTMRLRDATKGEIERTARENQRSLSEEIEARVENSFQTQSIANQVLGLVYGPQLAGILRMIGDAMIEAGWAKGYETTSSMDGLRAWLNHPEAVAAARHAAIGILNAVSPAGTLKLEPAVDTKALNSGRGSAMAVVSTLKDTSGAPRYKKDRDEIVEMLGPIFDRMTVNSVRGDQ